jgi:hypothetical protein
MILLGNPQRKPEQLLLCLTFALVASRLFSGIAIAD